jgi:hypothetical protein
MRAVLRSLLKLPIVFSDARPDPLDRAFADDLVAPLLSLFSAQTVGGPDR